ncbi:MAG: PEP-utilizing enzyme [Parcubacteria group bacterium]
MEKTRSKNKSKWWLWTEREGIAVSYCNLRDSAHPFHPAFKKFAKTYLGHIYLWEGDKISIYWKQQDLDNFAKFFLREIKKETNFLDRLEKYHFKNGRNLIAYSKKFSKIDFSSKGDKELLKYLSDFEKAYENLAIYTYIPVIATFAIEDEVIPYLKSKLKDAGEENKLGEYFSKLAYNPGKSWARLSDENLWKIVKMIRKGESISGTKASLALKKHAEKFGWQSLGYQFLGPIMEPGDFIPRLKDLSEKGLSTLPGKKEIAKNIKDIENKLNIDKRHHDLFSALRKIIYLKEYRDGIYTRSHQYINILFKEVIRRFDVPKEARYFMKFSEYKDLVGGKNFDFREVSHRDGTFMWMCDGKENYHVGTEAEKIIGREIGKKSLVRDVKTEIMGVVASHGIARGAVKVLNNEQDLMKVKAGDILIAHMTKPSYLPAMRKASAFVTDEGGVTCHAAIVAREMKKPCIIGTKIATQILHDGDLVEVDADRGTVRILKINS